MYHNIIYYTASVVLYYDDLIRHILRCIHTTRSRLIYSFSLRVCLTERIIPVGKDSVGFPLHAAFTRSRGGKTDRRIFRRTAASVNETMISSEAKSPKARNRRILWY